MNAVEVLIIPPQIKPATRSPGLNLEASAPKLATVPTKSQPRTLVSLRQPQTPAHPLTEDRTCSKCVCIERLHCVVPSIEILGGMARVVDTVRRILCYMGDLNKRLVGLW